MEFHHVLNEKMERRKNMKKVLLCILDGVGLSEEKKGNAFYHAKKPTLERLMKEYPNTTLEASGEYVGLPQGQMGNSEVGHMNIGAGRIVYQPLGLINAKIKENSFSKNKVLLSIFQHTKENHSKLHIMGLLSDGGIHSHINHFYAILSAAKEFGLNDVYFHIFTDGRDTSPYSGKNFINALEEKIREIGFGKIASISGRYYAMDRDNNYDRIKKAYDAMTGSSTENSSSALEAWQKNQDNKITDEFIVPTSIEQSGMITDNDGIIFANFRPDRVRELAAVLTNTEKNYFGEKKLKNIKMATLMPISNEAISTPMFQLEDLISTLGEYTSKLGLTQLRIAETEKYAHVTYFFDGGKEKQLEGEKRILIPSPKVATYDLKPQMSAYEITDSLLKELKDTKPDLTILNFANGDMVGHTGNYEAAIQAVETLDQCLTKIINTISLEEYEVIITADHGNCEVMINPDGSINTQHTTNVVPFIVLDQSIQLQKGKLGDIAVTILNLMEQPVPKEMTGKNLLIK